MTEETVKCRHCEQEFAKNADPPNAVYCHPCKAEPKVSAYLCWIEWQESNLE